MLVHRALLGRPTQLSREIPSAAIAGNAARSQVHVLQHLKNSGKLEPLFWLAPFNVGFTQPELAFGRSIYYLTLALGAGRHRVRCSAPPTRRAKQDGPFRDSHPTGGPHSNRDCRRAGAGVLNILGRANTPHDDRSSKGYTASYSDLSHFLIL